MLLMACKKEKKDGPVLKACPEVSSNLSIPAAILGEWRLKHEGNDGLSVDGVSLISSCQWTINGTENGGVGNPYAVKNSNESILLRWENNQLYQFEIDLGWTGSTEKGIVMGDSLPKVQTAYPHMSLIGFYTNIYGDTTNLTTVWMNFNPTTKKLEQIILTAR